ncbi:uncharacterized protein LOC130994180 [Salvia miltiorrhiza]|uniref:uncharacterized protein LOC130994180 n=1 Tax=Salvia miltiorrhiza TaxID=226208 RepID=UPI0025AC0205|nr:uncharacterized protein LOC130994180 [Salvia miltiorrhiza]
MKRYFHHIPSTSVDGSSSTVNGPTTHVEPGATSAQVNIEVDLQPEPSSKVVDLLNLPSDPGLRPNIMSYPPNMIEQIASIKCLRYLLMQGMAFRGHDESEESLNQGNFMELLKLLASCSKEISNVVLKNAPENLKLTSPDIQKDIINAIAVETTRAIIDDIGNDFFAILVDECRDVSVKEQMVHVSDTIATSLEKGIDSLFSTYGLSISSLRGQGYDGASNMRGEFSGLKTLILKRNPNAYYVHCFAHQLQLTIVAVAKKHIIVGSFFNTISPLCNVVGGSCKRRDMLRESQREKIMEGIASDEIKTERGLNQEMGMKRPGDTRWSSHYGTLINLIHLFTSVVDVLEYVGANGTDDSQKSEAMDLLDVISRFEFVFVLHLMKKILGITHDLSQVLQRKEQDIVNAMRLVNVAKTRLQAMRDKEWEMMLTDISKFCSKNKIEMIDMEDEYAPRGRGRRRVEKMTNLHHYRVELFYTVIDMQALELNQRFDEVNTELILCMSCLDPRDSFAGFDIEKLVRLAKFYPSEFSEVALYELESQLENFIVDVRMDEKFLELSGIGDLAEKMLAGAVLDLGRGSVRCGDQCLEHDMQPVGSMIGTKQSFKRLSPIRLRRTLLMIFIAEKGLSTVAVATVATATVERAFSAMKIIKSVLRNRMGDNLLNDCLVPYIEKDVFVNVTNEAIMQRFQNMKNRREML